MGMRMAKDCHIWPKSAFLSISSRMMWSASWSVRDPVPRDLPDHPDGEPGAGKRLPVDHVVGQAQLLPRYPHLVLEKLPEGLDELQPHPLWQAADVVMALDGGRGPLERDALYHVRIERALGEVSHVAKFQGLFLENLDECPADDLTLPLGIPHALQGGQEPLFPVDVLDVQVKPVLEKVEHFLGFVLPEHAVVHEDAGQP